jgi:hypothetical protein
LHSFLTCSEAVEIKKNVGGTVVSHFRVKAATDMEKLLFDLIRLVVELNLPLSTAEEPLMRSFSKHDVKIGTKTLRETIFKLVELVELRIKEELKSAPGGQIMYDGWTRNATHFLGVFASYMRTVSHVKKGITMKEEVPTITLLSCSPMAQVPNTNEDSDSDTDSDDDEEATKFNAETQAQFVEDSIDWYDLVLAWIYCLLADNTTTNRKTARILGKPHVPCHSHLSSLEVHEMVKNDAILSKTSKATHKTMVEAKQSLKNRAITRKLTNLSPIVGNDTRWSGMYDEFVRMRKIYTVRVV